MKFRTTDRLFALLAVSAALALSGCGSGKPTAPVSSGGVADSAASAASTMPPPATAGKAPSAP